MLIFVTVCILGLIFFVSFYYSDGFIAYAKTDYGYIVKTLVPWHIVAGQTLYVNIVNEANVPESKINVVEQAIMSNETIALDDPIMHKGPTGSSSVYYKGWEGALVAASINSTRYQIPNNFRIVQSSPLSGDILIKLTSELDPDGLTGKTKPLTFQNKIVRSTIMIYGADKLSGQQIATITRHEFGHALGLEHSTDPEDLMHASIQMEYPYISPCDVDAIRALYDGNQLSQVVCKK